MPRNNLLITFVLLAALVGAQSAFAQMRSTQRRTATAQYTPPPTSPQDLLNTRRVDTSAKAAAIEACRRYPGLQGVLTQPEILIRRMPDVEFLPGTLHEFVFAGDWEGWGVGGVRKLDRGATQQSIGADGLAFWAGGVNLAAFWGNQPSTGIANYSIAFVYDLPVAPCEAELFYVGTPALELPNGYTVSGKSSPLSWVANNHIVEKVDANGGFNTPEGYGVAFVGGDWTQLAAFDYIEWERHDKGPLLPEYHPVGSDPSPYLIEEGTLGSVVLEPGQQAQLVFEFDLKVGAWCLKDCAPMNHIAGLPGSNGNADLADIDDLAERGLLSVTTFGPGVEGTQPGVLFFMGGR